jgi:hypothetical protein
MSAARIAAFSGSGSWRLSGADQISMKDPSRTAPCRRGALNARQKNEIIESCRTN